MTMGDHVRQRLGELADLAERVGELLAPEVEAVARMVAEALLAGRTVFFCGNGGSAADAQHLSAEYVVRFSRARGALPAVALTTDTSVLTAAANDFGFENVFSRQLEGLGSEGDVLFLHSTSGESENLIRVAETARDRRILTVAFLARGGGRLGAMVDRAIVIPTDSTPRAQELHLTLGHLVCEMVEDLVAGEDG